MIPKILTIVPNKNRKPSGFYESFVQNTKHSDLIFAVEQNFHKKEFHIENASYEIIPQTDRKGCVFPLNYVANKYCKHYTHLVFMADDNRIRTKDWDVILYESIKNVKFGIAYPNDLLQGENLPTVVMLDSMIVRTLGYMVPDMFVHQYADNFWKDLGQRFNTLRYLPDVVVEHLTWVNQKSSIDPLYEQGLSLEQISTQRYFEYKEKYFEVDVNRLLSAAG